MNDRIHWGHQGLFFFFFYKDYIGETIAEWRRLNIDVLLCPVIGPAFNFFYCGKLSSTVQ